MSQDEFRVKQSVKGYRVELCRNGKPYVTFVDGLTKQGAEQEARSLTAFWSKISGTPSPANPSPLNVSHIEMKASGTR